MDFYRKKTDAYRLIDELYGKKLKTDIIVFKIQTQFGFSEKFVKKRLDLLERVLKEK